MGASPSEILDEEKKKLSRVIRQLERQRDRAMERAADELINARNALHRGDKDMASEHARIKVYASQSATRLTRAIGRIHRVHDQLSVADAQAQVGSSLVVAADALLAVNVQLDVESFFRSSRQFAQESAKLSQKMATVDATMDMATEDEDADSDAEPFDEKVASKSIIKQLEEEIALDLESKLVDTSGTVRCSSSSAGPSRRTRLKQH